MNGRRFDEMVVRSNEIRAEALAAQQAQSNPKTFDLEGMMDGFFYTAKDNVAAWVAGDQQRAEATQDSLSQQLGQILDTCVQSGIKEVAPALQDALQEFHALAYNYVQAAKSGDQTAIDNSNISIINQAKKIGDLLSSMSPQTWPVGQAADELAQFVEEMKAEALAAAQAEAPAAPAQAIAPAPVGPSLVSAANAAAPTNGSAAPAAASVQSANLSLIINMLRGRNIPITQMNIRTWWPLFFRNGFPSNEQINAAVHGAGGGIEPARQVPYTYQNGGGIAPARQVPYTYQTNSPPLWWGGGAGPYPAPQQLQSEPFTYIGPGQLRHKLLQLWHDHVAATHNVLVAIDANEPVQIAQSTAILLDNYVRLGRVFSQWYGMEAGAQFATVMQQHSMLAVDYMWATLMEDAARQQATLNSLMENAKVFAKMLAAINPHYWLETSMLDLMQQHLNHTKAYIDARAAGDFETEGKQLRQAYAEIQQLAEAIYLGIRRQYGLDQMSLTTPAPPAWTR